MITSNDIQKIAEHLNGSCNGVEQVFEDFGFDFYDTPVEFLAELDELTMRCDCCGWWVDSDQIQIDDDEMVRRQICTGCFATLEDEGL